MLKVDIRNRILKPKVGEIITVIGDIYTTVAETIPDEKREDVSHVLSMMKQRWEAIAVIL